MKNAGVRMDLEHDRAEIFGRDVALNFTSSGHYCIPIDKTQDIPVKSMCAIKLDAIDEKERPKILLKLHRICTSFQNEIDIFVDRCWGMER